MPGGTAFAWKTGAGLGIVMGKSIWKWFLQGIAMVAPVALTIALLFWLGSMAEHTVGGLIKAVLPEGWYFRGLGLVAGILATLAIGLAANIFLIRWTVGFIERLLDRIPLVKSLVQGFKDITRLVAHDMDEQLGQVVAVDLGELRLVGFVMQQTARLPAELPDDDRVAVYVAMSYQLGGFTLHVPRERITPLDISADQAMRAVLTGGSLVGEDAGQPRAQRP
jgi:uncharacterized membrane protein